MNELQIILAYRKSKKSVAHRAPAGFVTGFDGSHIKREMAVRINEQYYELDKTCFYIRGSFYRFNDPNLQHNHSTGQKDLAQYMRVGIVNISNEKGYFSKESPYVEARVFENLHNEFRTTFIISEEVAIKAGYWECLNSGYFYKTGTASEFKDHKRGPINYEGRIKLTERPGQTPQSIPQNTRYGLASATYSKSEGKRYSFGVEVETSQGFIPVHVRHRMNVACMRDASITAGEYVTGILTGDQGFIHLRSIITELAKRCEVDSKTGIHVHLGNFLPDKEFTVFSYWLGFTLQYEISQMMPPSRRKNEFAQPLDKSDTPYIVVEDTINQLKTADRFKYDFLISNCYEVIFKWLSGGVSVGAETNKTKAHPKGRYCGGHSSARYKWLNLVPTNFSKMRLDGGQTGALPIDCSDEPVQENIVIRDSSGRPQGLRPRSQLYRTPEPQNSGSYTIEFRNHGGSLNYTKIESWILITMSLVWCVENRKDAIINGYFDPQTPLTLLNLIKEAYPKSHGTLINYINERTKIFSRNGSETAEYKLNPIKETTSIKEFITENFNQTPK